MINIPTATDLFKRQSPMQSYDIPEDVIIEIFKRLPVKSLICLKCVNKAWRDLISSSDFATLHFDLNKHKPLSYLRMSEIRMQLFTNGKHAAFLRRPFLKDPNKYARLGRAVRYLVGSSSNGLVCLRGTTNYSNLTVWNPATGDFRDIERLKKYMGGSKLVGFDVRPCGDYRVVVIALSRGKLNEVQMHSRSSNCWKIISNEVAKEDMIITDDEVVSLDGCMYWRAYNLKRGGGMKPFYNVACFDMWEEKYRLISVPPSISRTARLGVVNGSSLGFFMEEVNGTLDGWVMNGQDGSWTKQYCVVPYKPQQFIESMSDEEVDIIIYDRQLHCYHHATKRFCSFTNLSNHLDVVQYKEALFSVYDPTM